MSRGELTPRGNEGRPEWWQGEMRESFLNIVIDLEKYYESESSRVEERVAKSRARKKYFEKIKAPQVFIDRERKLVTENYTSLKVTKETLVDFVRYTGGIGIGSLRLVLLFLWRHCKENVDDPVKWLSNYLPYFIWIGVDKDPSLYLFCKSIGKVDEEQRSFARTDQQREEQVVGDGIAQVIQQLLLELQAGNFDALPEM